MWWWWWWWKPSNKVIQQRFYWNFIKDTTFSFENQFQHLGVKIIIMQISLGYQRWTVKISASYFFLFFQFPEWVLGTYL